LMVKRGVFGREDGALFNRSRVFVSVGAAASGQ
jgi:hypothetical protein